MEVGVNAPYMEKFILNIINQRMIRDEWGFMGGNYIHYVAYFRRI